MDQAAKRSERAREGELVKMSAFAERVTEQESEREKKFLKVKESGQQIQS